MERCKKISFEKSDHFFMLPHLHQTQNTYHISTPTSRQSLCQQSHLFSLPLPLSFLSFLPFPSNPSIPSDTFFDIIQSFWKACPYNNQQGMQSRELGQSGVQQRQLKRQIAFIMTSFQDAMESYSSNRKQLDSMLNQLLKVYRTYKIYKNAHRIINKATNKQDLYFQFCILNNISCCYATKKETSKSCEYIKLADRQLKAILELYQKSELDYQTRKQQAINLHMRMIKLKLQLCGVYALNVQHVESLHESSQAFGLLESVINSVCDYSMGEKFNEDFLELQKCVAEPNTEISEKEIKNTYWNNIMNCQSDEQVRNIFLTIFKNLHSKEQMQARSCLGKIIFSKQDKVQVISSQSKKYLKEFSIGSVMKISPIMLQEFNRVKRKQEYVSLKYLHELTILLSLTHFTVSTELRLGSMYDQQPTAIESFDDDINMVKKQKRMIEAERHHFFAIEIIYKMATPYVKECPFFARLVKGYEQVYLLKDNFEIIPEKVEEQNETSLLSIKNKGNRYDYKQHEDYYLKKMKESKCETPRSLAKKELRADLYRMRKKKQQQQKGEKVKNSRKTPSTHKSGAIFLSPKHLPKHMNKSREKDMKTGLKKGLQKAVSPGMRKSRNQMGTRSPHKDYTSYG